MKRLLIPRSDVIKVDEAWKFFKWRQRHSLVTIRFPLVGEGGRIDKRLIKVYSVRTGKLSRFVEATPVEIEGVSPTYYMLNTNKKFRSREYVRDDATGQWIYPVAIARHMFTGRLVYDLGSRN